MLGTWENAQSLIMSLNAWGFLLFSPYTHHWPMTHQPLDLHSKPLLHYLNHQASFLEGWRANLRRLTVYHCGPLLISDVHKTWSTSIRQSTAHAVHFSRPDAPKGAVCVCREPPWRAGLRCLPASGETEHRAPRKLTSRSVEGRLSKTWYVPA